MSILTIEWGTLHSSPLASAEPLETELTPTSSYLTAYTPLEKWGPVATSSENTAAFMTVTWQPRRGTSDLPYDATDLAVTAGEYEKEAETPGGGSETPTGGGSGPAGDNPGTGSTPSGSEAGTGTAGGGSGQVKHAAPHLAMVAKLGVSDFLGKGLKMKLELLEAARVEAVLTVRERRKVKGKVKVVDVPVSKVLKGRTGAGATTLTLHSDPAGRRLLKAAEKAVRARLEVKLTFADGTTRRLTRSLTLTPSSDS